MITKRKTLNIILVTMLALLVSVGIAYAALSATMTITFGNVTQSQLTWNVGFTGSTATATAGGTGETGRVCGTASITANSVTVADTTLSKPGDSCTYTLTVQNGGTIPAKFNTITPTAPSGATCSPISGGNMVCGNITYKLTSDAAGNDVLTTGNTIAATGTQTIYLVIKYTGSDVAESAPVQKGATFTLTYDQA